MSGEIKPNSAAGSPAPAAAAAANPPPKRRRRTFAPYPAPPHIGLAPDEDQQDWLSRQSQLTGLGQDEVASLLLCSSTHEAAAQLRTLAKYQQCGFKARQLHLQASWSRRECPPAPPAPSARTMPGSARRLLVPLSRRHNLRLYAVAQESGLPLQEVARRHFREQWSAVSSLLEKNPAGSPGTSGGGPAAPAPTLLPP
jgi:hypothetical protein